MKTKHIFIGISCLLLGLIGGRYLLPVKTAETPTLVSADAPSPSVWTCSMHPQIQQPEPGGCPICGMDLIPVESGRATDDGPRQLSMSESSRALAEIQTSVVERTYPEAAIRLVGKLEYDETKVRSLSARFAARIEKLFVNYNGIRVERGEHLAEVYSPELLSAQRELLTSYQRAPESTLTQAAREKLRQWDLLPEQIDALLTAGVAEDRFELRSPISGIVVAKNVKEGDYVKTGEPLFKIADLSELWLFLDAYESDLPWLRYGQTVEFTVEAYPGESFEGQIAFIEPELDRQTRTVSVRVNVLNTEGRLKPGMFARGVVHARIGEDGHVHAPDYSGKWICPMHPEVVSDVAAGCRICGMDLVPAEQLGYVDAKRVSAPLVVPSSAVLQTGKRAVVYVADAAAERPTYEGREITLGPRAGDVFIVRDGLKEGERVVTKGAFKIDSALQIQAKPSMMSMKEAPAVVSKNESELYVKLMPLYLDMQSALAADDYETANEAAKQMMAVSGHAGPLAEVVHALMGAESIDAMRRPHFETLSNQIIEVVKAHPDAFDGELYLMNCSMVYPDHGADWIQSDQELLNPYWGSQMLHCGEVKKKLGE